MQTIEGAVIACAGLGSRLGMGLPKCMIEIDGQTILSRLIRGLRPIVPQIHVVVGYREEIVSEYCSRYYRDVILVRNPNYRTTNTAHSLRLGCLGFKRKMLCLDGDLLINGRSLEEFANYAISVPLLIGVTAAKSSQAVFVATREGSGAGTLQVTGFDRDVRTQYEWANVFAGPPSVLESASGYVFEALAPHLPAAAHQLRLFEVDTASDLAHASSGVGALLSGEGG